MKEIEAKVYKIVAGIPAGKLLSYGIIAKRLNINPRQVGRILHQNPDPKNIPCHRVVNSRGEVAQNYAFGGNSAQKSKLISEGIIFRKDKIELKSYLY